MTGLSIEDMGLSPLTRKAAESLRTACPWVVFTSGRRDLWQQAHAMAVNVALNRAWIRQTYLHAADLQQWVDTHPEAVSVDQLTVGLYEELERLSVEEQRAISRHLTGDAFDILPLIDKTGASTQEGDAIIQAIMQLEGLEKFLTHEGGLVRWHCQFTPSAEV